MKLNISSTGSKPVFYHGEAICKNILKSVTYMFVYDGTTITYLNSIFVQND